MAEFREHAKVDMNQADAVQVADAFGLLYAAGEIGKACSLLPEKWHCGNAALLPFRQLPFTQQSFASFDDQLRNLANAPDTIDLDNLPADAEADTITKTKVFIRKRAGQSRLMIRIDAVGEMIPHWRARQTMPDVIARAVREKGHATVQRRLPGGERVRMYVFELPTQ